MYPLHTPDDVRRGKRLRYAPLEWWRQEKVVYGRREAGMTFVPHIKEIRRVPKDVVIPLGGKTTRKKGPRSKSQTVEKAFVFNPEEGWDANTDQQGIVIDFASKEEVQRRQSFVPSQRNRISHPIFSGIALTAKMVEPQAAANNDWFFQKVFGDGDFIAAGQLIIPPKGRKPSKGTKDNTYVSPILKSAHHLINSEADLLCDRRRRQSEGPRNELDSCNRWNVYGTQR